MRPQRALVLVLLLLLSLTVGLINSKILDTSQVLLARQKRFLIYQPGINWIQLIVGIGLPIELEDQSLTWGAAAKSYYLLPTNASDFTSPSITIGRGKRSTSRWKLYSSLEYFADRIGVFGSGKACLLRAICEIASTPLDDRAGLLAEVLHLILTPSSTDDEIERNSDFEYQAAEKLGKETDKCFTLFPECQTNLLDQFTRIFM